MRNRLEDAKSDLLAEAAAIVEHHRGAQPPPGREDAEALLRRYYRHVAPEDLVGRDPVDVYGAAMSQRQLAERRPQGTANVRAYVPTLDEHGWASGHTVVEVVTDDMPFLVDSVTMELSRQDRGLHLVIHPQLVVRRDLAGDLIEVCDISGADAALAEYDDAVVESWMHVEIDRESDPEALRAIEQDLQRVLRDVREAVEDWDKMRQRTLDLADEIAATAFPLPAEEVSEAEELMRWLADEHFTFLGYREYALESVDGEDALRAVTGSGLGILRSDQDLSDSFAKLPPVVRSRAREKRLLVLTKANSRATVHRPTYLDYVGVKAFDQTGEVVGERRFLGLLSSAAYTESVLRIPVLRRKVVAVLAKAGFTPTSHSGKDLQQILETYPRDELFQISAEDMTAIATAVMHLQERRQLRLFVRPDDYGRFVSCLVFLPRDRFNTDVRMRMQDILLRATGGASVDYTARVSESVLARLHFVIRMAPGQELPDVDVAALEDTLAAATRRWSDDFADALAQLVGEEEAARLMRRYGKAFPEAYKEDFPAPMAIADLRRLEALQGDELGINLYQPLGATATERRLKLYRSGREVSLSDVLPRLSQMGVEVVDERPYELVAADGARSWVYDFGLHYGHAPEEPAEHLKELFQDAFAAVWRGDAESDGFNALVLRAGLPWREVSVLRAYAKYLRQAGTTFSQDYLEDSLVANTDIVAMLVELFATRLDPDRFVDDPDARAAAAEEVSARVVRALDDVASLDQDRILRSFLGLVLATLRTNFYQPDADGALKPYVSFKLDPAALPDLPRPRPRYEIWVYAPRVEGVHLRFGAVARGGLRWSDRREDFRTEVLGLVKAQAVKNSVIVPVGAKGGFVAKQLPPLAEGREAWLAEGVESYQTFIHGLLDLTDNRVERDGGFAVEPPPRVVRHDGDDPYLVVAADKGTATFSDIANGISAEYGFWLGDAFASGGSAGYDHKAMGITARGAWESVKRHFREMGRDCQSEDFTCVGVGDMSGDVFGNGMLLSRHIRLVAAFDHRHVFLDPDPDAEASWAERKRLFELPRSSWQDYDAALISAGGGVYPRTAKAIPVSAEVRRALGIAAEVSSMTPAELMHAILAAPVDLLWNGGIGTYVKASTESHADVGDRANDALRVDGAELRCACVGEGGNLGLTQLGRVEYALNDGRICTDAIDNSAGVDTSDHEVNIKILLDRVVRAEDLTRKQRDELLVEMTDEVAELVLADNRGQNVALASALAQASSLVHVHKAFIRQLEHDGRLDRALEYLPSDRQLLERQQQGAGLTAPEFAVLLAYTKNLMYAELVETSLPDDEYLRTELHGYFPRPIRERYPDQIDEHPLRREIITTRVVNNLVNNAGTTYAYRLAIETGASLEDLARAHTVARVAFVAQQLWATIEALEGHVAADVLTRMRLEVRTIVERASRWLVTNRRPPIDIGAQVELFAEPVARVMEELPAVLCGRELALFEERRDNLLGAGVPKEVAVRVAALPPAYASLGIVEVHTATGADLHEVARVHFKLGERLWLGRLLERIVALPRQDRWQTMARAALRDDLHAVHAALTAQVLTDTEADPEAEQRVDAWMEQDAVVVARAAQTLADIVDGDQHDLARLSVGLRVVRTLLRSLG